MIFMWHYFGDEQTDVFDSVIFLLKNQESCESHQHSSGMVLFSNNFLKNVFLKNNMFCEHDRHTKMNPQNFSQDNPTMF